MGGKGSGNWKPVGERLREKIIAAYEPGMTITALAGAIGCSRTYARHTLDAAGLRHDVVSDKKIRSRIVKAVAERDGVSEAAIRTRVFRYGENEAFRKGFKASRAKALPRVRSGS